MKLTSVLLLGLLPTAMVATSSSQTFSITVSPSQVETKSGSPIRITVRLANTSDSEINLGAEAFMFGGVDARFKYDCRNESGQSVAKTYPELGNLGDRQMVILKPGEIHTETIDTRPSRQLCTKFSNTDTGGEQHACGWLSHVDRHLAVSRNSKRLRWTVQNCKAHCFEGRLASTWPFEADPNKAWAGACSWEGL
jgi:hypothetical protein